MRETILTIILILLLAATGALWFFYRPAAPGAAGPSQAGRAAELDRYRSLQGISPDTNLFTDPGFRALRRVDEVPAVPPPPLPRNLFQPLP